MKNNFERSESEVCEFCKASAFVDCAPDCPCNFAEFGAQLPESLRSMITMELLKQAEYIYERKQSDWMSKMLIERVESVMKDWPTFMNFIKILHELDFFKTPQDVIDYLEKPSKAERIYLLWSEMGEPITQGTQPFDMFNQAVKGLKKENDGRANREEE